MVYGLNNLPSDKRTEVYYQPQMYQQLSSIHSYDRLVLNRLSSRTKNTEHKPDGNMHATPHVNI